MYFSTLLSLAIASTALVRAQDPPLDPSTTEDCIAYTSWPNEWFPEQGETCASIADFWAITEEEFIAWNPIVGSECENLIEGNLYCVEEDPSAGNPGPTTAPSPSSTTSSSATTSTSGSGAPSPTQGGLSADCQRFYLVESGDFCQAIVDEFGTFSLNEFYSWNPAVGNSCGGLQAGYYVCVGVSDTPTSPPSPTTTSAPTSTGSNGPSPTQGGLTPDCQRFYLVESGDYCVAIVEEFGTFTLNQFYSWNPAVGNNCGGLQAGYHVCVGVSGTPTTRPSTSTRPTTTAAPAPTGPQPQQPNIVPGCLRFHQVQAGDTCAVIANRYRTFTVAQFLSWNPDVGSACQSLWLGYHVCIGVAGTPTTPPTTTRATSTGIATPTPVQAGMVRNCNRFGQANSGGTCPVFANRFGISLSQLYAWNPVLGGSGQNCQTSFWAWYHYCVGVSR